MPKEQKIVLHKRLSEGYTLIGQSQSRSCSGNVFIVVKGCHTMAINCLGYDEHIKGITWKLKGTHE